ncbi:hypothetical protein GCM10010252_13270 [Streptomyces aureoverticillatus]|nr:hypothetical protein GCM10010252_13270 [Streptomyces aureoverticillatus]
MVSDDDPTFTTTRWAPATSARPFVPVTALVTRFPNGPHVLWTSNLREYATGLPARFGGRTRDGRSPGGPGGRNKAPVIRDLCPFIR